MIAKCQACLQALNSRLGNDWIHWQFLVRAQKMKSDMIFMQ